MTTARGTPNLNIAATQNTAPVYEFRCLYSHDLRKKKKLWHDGSLRYHTFNKRVMVYDESKNYIGDSHWRDAEELQEGTELKLDKGVLVDVGDRIGETQTDLAPLLEKRRPENESSPPRPPLRPISLAATSRTASGNPQARLKSLSDVLGISQGPIGRAIFPTQSPYEQLHHPPGRKSHCEEPPAKKPRNELDKENVELRGDRIHRGDPLVKTSLVAPIGRSSISGTSSLQERRKAAPAGYVIDISSEDEPALLPSSPPTAASRVKASAWKGFNSGDNHQQVPKTSMPPPRKQTNSTSPARSKVTRPKLLTSKPLPVSRGASFHNPPTKSRSSTGSSKSKLRLAPHKPRKKLLYQEFLPSSTKSRSQLHSRTSLASHRTPSQEQQSSRTRDCRPARVNTFSNLEIACEDDNIAIGKAGSSKQPSGKMQDIDRDLAELFAQSSSPLFMPELPARFQTRAPESQSPDSFPSMALGEASTLTPSPNCLTAPHGGNGPAAPGATTPIVNGVSQPAPLSKLTILDQQLMMPRPNIVALPSEPQQTSPQPRSLRRVVSENDSPGYARNQGCAASAVPGRHTVEVVKGSILLGQRPFKSPAKLTKSLSDTGAKSRVRPPLAARSAEEESAEDCGPWSKAEAYLLFDWFPPGREKLVFDNGEQNSTSMTVVKRGLLSDQLDAL